MHKKNKTLIQFIQNLFGNIDYLSKHNNILRVKFKVSTIKDIINIIIPNFINYSSIIIKSSNYIYLNMLLYLYY